MKYEENIFSKIVNRQIGSEIIEETDFFISIYDINPQSKIHILIISKKNYINLNDFLLKSEEEEQLDLNKITKKLIKKFNLENFKLLTNNGKKSGQEIFHFHVHLIG